MPKLIKDGAITADSWTVLKEATGPEILKAVQGKNLIVPLEFWQLYQDELGDYNGAIGLWLNSHETATSVKDELAAFEIIALNFPAFSDGRSYSNARQLRQEYQYKGDIRAIGDVLRDQLYYMQQCGFSSFSLRHDQDTQDCLSALSDFSNNYQATVKQPLPLFRRR